MTAGTIILGTEGSSDGTVWQAKKGKDKSLILGTEGSSDGTVWQAKKGKDKSPTYQVLTGSQQNGVSRPPSQR